MVTEWPVGVYQCYNMPVYSAVSRVKILDLSYAATPREES